MAVFEAKRKTKVLIDDTLLLTCVIETAHYAKDHTEYILKVYRGPQQENGWTVARRYSDFVTMDALLRLSGYDLALPPKKVFGNMDREFIAERQTGLQTYLNTILGYHLLASSYLVKQFLDPQNYTSEFQEIALKNVSMIFRSEPTWHVVEPLPEIGWRIRKHFFMVKQLDSEKAQHLMSWCEFGPDTYLSDKEMSQIMKILPAIQHPYIFPITLASATDSGAFVIRDFHEHGTLQDLICKTKPKLQYLKKYGQLKHYCYLQLSDIRRFGRQILEALRYLQEKGFPYGHLHTGNIILTNNKCQLLDIENWSLGLPSKYRHCIALFKKIQTIEAIDIYNFGRVLYEMACGEAFFSATCDTFPDMCPPALCSVLEKLVTTEACKNGLPSVSELLALPFFAEVVSPPTEKPVMKIPSRLKEAIKNANESVEKRIKEDQKRVSQVRRRSKAEAYHKQEDKKKKRRSKRASMGQIIKTNGTANSTSSPQPVSSTLTSTIVPSPPPPPPLPPSSQVKAAPVAPPLAPPPPPSAPPSAAPAGKQQLLNSISGFNKNGLKKAVTVDKSAPKV